MSRRAGALISAAAVALVGGGAVMAGGLASSPATAQSTPPPSGTATITRKTLIATTQIDGALGYAGSYTVVNDVPTSAAGSIGGGGDLAQAYASAKEQYDQAVAALDLLRHPTSADLGPLRTQVAQAVASVVEATATLASDRAAYTSADDALSACDDGPSPTPAPSAGPSASPAPTQAPSPQACDLAALREAVTQAQGRVAVDEAQLASARAARSAAQAALTATEHPSSAQVRQAEDGVATARAALDAASALVDAPRGVLTQVAQVGSTVQAGGTLYALDGDHPVLLLIGDVPAWRDLHAGVSDGVDIRELETNLQAMGFAPTGMTVDERWDADTTAAVEAWQQALGLPQTGVVSMGAVVFEPAALRVTVDSAGLGATVQPGTPILQATSTAPVVTVALDPALRTEVQVGDPVSVTMPDGSTAAGSVDEVGTVATLPHGSNGPGTNPTPTIAVTITLDRPSATDGLDQAPVSVNITTATVRNVLAVPVGALVELLEGGYAVQIRAPDGSLNYVRVQLGLFADGWVQVSGQGLAAGEIVTVAQ